MQSGTKSGTQALFCDNFPKFTPLLTTFHRYNNKCMAHKNKIISATSPLFCNRPT